MGRQAVQCCAYLIQRRWYQLLRAKIPPLSFQKVSRESYEKSKKRKREAIARGDDPEEGIKRRKKSEHSKQKHPKMELTPEEFELHKRLSRSKRY